MLRGTWWGIISQHWHSNWVKTTCFIYQCEKCCCTGIQWSRTWCPSRWFPNEQICDRNPNKYSWNNGWYSFRCRSCKSTYWVQWCFQNTFSLQSNCCVFSLINGVIRLTRYMQSIEGIRLIYLIFILFIFTKKRMSDYCQENAKRVSRTHLGFNPECFEVTTTPNSRGSQTLNIK